MLEIDLGSVIVAARTGIPALLRRPEPRAGRFLAVASAAATRGLPMLAAYCAAKAGVAGLVRALAAELRGTGVTANAVSPGSTATATLDESARLYALESAEAFSAQQPLDRLIRPEEVAEMLVWLGGAGEQRGHRRRGAGGRRARPVTPPGATSARSGAGAGPGRRPRRPARAAARPMSGSSSTQGSGVTATAGCSSAARRSGPAAHARRPRGGRGAARRGAPARPPARSAGASSTRASRTPGRRPRRASPM